MIMLEGKEVFQGTIKEFDLKTGRGIILLGRRELSFSYCARYGGKYRWSKNRKSVFRKNARIPKEGETIFCCIQIKKTLRGEKITACPWLFSEEFYSYKYKSPLIWETEPDPPPHVLYMTFTKELLF